MLNKQTTLKISSNNDTLIKSSLDHKKSNGSRNSTTFHTRPDSNYSLTSYKTGINTKTKGLSSNTFIHLKPQLNSGAQRGLTTEESGFESYQSYKNSGSPTVLNTR
jgi:hypothetical protein